MQAKKHAKLSVTFKRTKRSLLVLSWTEEIHVSLETVLLEIKVYGLGGWKHL